MRKLSLNILLAVVSVAAFILFPVLPASAANETEAYTERTITNLAPVNIWLSRGWLDLGLRTDIKAEVFLNGSLLSSGQINSMAIEGGLFSDPSLIDIPFTPFTPTAVPDGATLNIKLSARTACSGSLRNAGTLRLWYGDRQVNSQLKVTIDTVEQPYYLRSNALLATSPGNGPRQQNSAQTETRCSDFKAFGTWMTTL